MQSASLAGSLDAKLLPPHRGTLSSTESPLPPPERTGHSQFTVRQPRVQRDEFGIPEPRPLPLCGREVPGVWGAGRGRGISALLLGTRPLVPDSPNHRPHFSPSGLTFQPLLHQASTLDRPRGPTSQHHSSCHTGRHRERERGVLGCVALGKSLCLSGPLISSSINCGIKARGSHESYLDALPPAPTEDRDQLTSPFQLWSGRQSFQNPVARPPPRSGPLAFPLASSQHQDSQPSLQGHRLPSVAPRTWPGCREVAFAHARPSLHGERPVLPNRRP